MAVPGPVVEGPPRRGLPYGLFSVLGALDGPDHWENGVTWEALGCAPASGIGDPDCEPVDPQGPTEATGLPKSFNRGGDLGEASAFTVYADYLCSPAGHTVEYAQERAQQRLIAREEARVERAIWTGDLGNEPTLLGATAILGSAVDAVHALDELEGYIASEYGSQGVIHVPRKGATTLGQMGLIVTNGSVARTLQGTPVVMGTGYNGTSPAGAPPASGSAWAYVTPALFGYRSAVYYPSSRPGDLLDREVNDLYGIAERSYLVGWDPCGVGAVEFTLGCC